jgi:threonine dehydrogenase-like Zn-dependent dehydrogenase
VQKYLQRLLERIQKREIDPSFVITNRMRLDDAPVGFAKFLEKQLDYIKIVLKPH